MTDLDDFTERVRALADLQPNWDSYDGHPITTRAIITAERLHTLLRDHQPEPIPMSHGGIALEWHHGNARLEIEIDPTGNVYVQDFEITEA